VVQNNNQDVTSIDTNNDNILRVIKKVEKRYDPNDIKAFLKDEEDEIRPHPNAKVVASIRSPHRSVKFMSDVLRKQVTPKASKALTLKIDVNQPEYDEDGQLVMDSDEEEEDPENFEGIFNAHLLEDENLDKDSYKGSITDESNTSQKVEV
jgi:hypothetical protein